MTRHSKAGLRLTAYRFCACVLMGGAAAPAWSQENSASEAGAPGSATNENQVPSSIADESQTAPNDIVVVGVKLGTTSVQDTPSTIQVVGSESLATHQVQTASDLTAIVPGLLISFGQGSAKIALRGIGHDSLLANSEAGVASYQDGVYIGRTVSSLGPLNDLDHVEVFKGPQGVNFGRNSVGGAILYISKLPRAGFHADLSAGYATFDHFKAAGVVNAGSSTLAGRLAVSFNRSDGFVRQLTLGGKTYGTNELSVRGSIRYNPIPELEAIFRLEYSRANNTYAAAVWGSNGTIPTLGNGVLPARADIQGLATASERILPVRSRSLAPTLEINAELGDVKIKSISAYSRPKFFAENDTESSPAEIVRTENTYRTKQYSEEIQASIKRGRFSGVIGGLLYREDVDESVFTFQNPPTNIARVIANNEIFQRTDSKAIFGFGSFDVTDSFRIFGGIRYTADKKRFRFKQTLTFPNRNVITVPCNNEFVAKANKLTGEGGMQYDVAQDQMIYIKYSRGFRAGGIGTAACPERYDPETIDAYEAGYKAQFFDGDLTFNLSVFDYRYRNLQVLINRLAPTGTQVSSTENAASAKIRGADLQFFARINSVLSVDSGAQFLDKANYGKYTTLSPVPAALNTVGLPTTFDLTGNRLNRAPTISATSGVNVEAPLSSDWAIRLRGEWVATSKITYTQFGNLLSPLFGRDSAIQAGYSLFNAYLTLTEADEDFSVQLYGTNLSDKFYTSGRALTPTRATTGVEFGRPREFGVVVRKSF